MEQPPRGITVTYQPRGWITNKLVKNWYLVVWNRRPGALLRKQGVLLSDAFERHLTPAIKAEIAGNSMNTNLVVIRRGGDLMTAGATCWEQTIPR
jgi:hypothetical protein